MLGQQDAVRAPATSWRCGSGIVAVPGTRIPALPHTAQTADRAQGEEQQQLLKRAISAGRNVHVGRFIHPQIRPGDPERR